MAKYKPGQFVKVDVPGKYRVHNVLKSEHPCVTCDLRKECYSYSLNETYLFGIPCVVAIGMFKNVKKVD